MKTKEEIEQIKEQCSELKKKLSELSEEELKEVSGGISAEGNFLQGYMHLWDC